MDRAAERIDLEVLRASGTKYDDVDDISTEKTADALVNMFPDIGFECFDFNIASDHARGLAERELPEKQERKQRVG